jgi:hypothetical protein
MKVKNPMLVILPSVAFVAGLGIFCYLVLGNYFVALGWHLRHGNHTVIRGYRVSVPLLWWREDYYGGNIGLIRAVPRYPLDEIETGAIEWYPVANSQLVATEDQALHTAQRDASHPIFADKPGDVISVVPLRRAEATMYCVREEISYFSALDCHLAGAPVVFRYSGDPEFEKDAESILSSMN